MYFQHFQELLDQVDDLVQKGPETSVRFVFVCLCLWELTECLQHFLQIFQIKIPAVMTETLCSALL